ncbi:MFS transporter [Paludibaculum fermentans]|uniref:MFS transporter n=1 Tax=Paludibaculum fermentans TaxID=1473598 RepID=UPI001E5F4F34|nr:MFS transporter [Paludibaculum fermentans]
MPVQEVRIQPNLWRIALLIAVAIAISYLDRQTLPVAIAAIQRDIPISNTQFSQLQAAFLVAYAVMYAGGGKLIDVLGTRRGFVWIMTTWSLACASHGFATGFRSLAVSRFLLGLGEGGGFPAATKAIAERFPVAQRSTAMGIINSGTAVGAMVAPPAIAAILGATSWRWVFFVTSLLGLLWTLWWLRDYTPVGAVQHGPAEPPIPWLRLLTFRETWGLVMAKFISDAAWYFYLFWLPKYLYDVRGFDTKSVGYYAWIPYALAGVGSLTGGWFSSRLLTAGKSLNFSRKLTLGLSAALMPIVALVSSSPVEMAIALFSVAFFGQQSWSTLVMILPADLFPRGAVGSVAGLVGFGGSMGGVVFNLATGFLLDHGFGYGFVLGLVSTFHIVAFLIILLTVRDVKPLAVERKH